MTETADQIDLLLRTVADVALREREEFDRLDDAAGDGDFGTTLARGVAALAANPPGGEAAERLRAASEAVTDAMGGSSGPLCGIALLRASESLGAGRAGSAELVRAAIAGIQEFGEAEQGDKTVIDALIPLAEALENGADAAGAAREAADGTTDIEARRGRAAYAGARSSGAPDPGAVCVAVVAEALAQAGDPPGWEELAGGRTDLGDGDEPAAPTGFAGDADSFVSDAVDGYVRANASVLARVDGSQAVVRRDLGDDDSRVRLVSGGGAGHEPMHAGFVGAGMLDAAVPGAVFTSPSPGEVLAATRAVGGSAGVLHVVKSYTGDILNFRMAAEFASDEGIEVEAVVVDDDVAIAADSDTPRRGTGVTIVVEKVAGALAAEGAPLAEVAEIARRVVERGRSFGVALHDDKMELGVGIHGEPGREPVPIEPAGAIAAAMLDPILEELPPDAPLLVLLSGLGGTPPLQLSVLFEHVAAELDTRGRDVRRSVVGDLITSLDQAGAVLTVVALDDDLTRLWDAPSSAPAFTRG
ncbi:MAG TPA: dihydroxyacetone kinase subunit DhaK [Thermoleophilaceae bacterium]|nr:dihydroxyacetone kinase subunit DhaK [Thermoleophilaceae bacterium]